MVIQVILLLVLIIFVAYSFGVGGEVFEDIAADVREDKTKQKDVADPAIIEVGNFASDTGTRVCDLQIKFYGSMSANDPFGIDPFNFGEERWLWHGDIENTAIPGILGFKLSSDTRIVSYEWFCPNVNVSAASIFWNIRQNTLSLFPETGEGRELSLLGDVVEGVGDITGLANQKTGGEVIRMFFQAESLKTGKLMLDKNAFGLDNKPFQASVTLPVGSTFTYDYVISTRLQDVTEDDYELIFWSQDYEMNKEEPGHRFTYFLCSPDSLVTNTIGTVTGKTLFGETITVNLDESRSVKEGC